MDFIRIEGARTHNLKNISVSIPKGKITVIAGPSGSGKSSLAYDTLYAEGQRRFLEGLSPYVRQFLNIENRPDVDRITGLSPAIAVQQRTRSESAGSTVGTATEILDYLRLLFAKSGTPYCPEHGLRLEATPVSRMAEEILGWPEGTPVLVLSPVREKDLSDTPAFLSRLARLGFQRIRAGGEVLALEDLPPGHPIPAGRRVEIVVDRLKLRTGVRERLSESLELAAALSGGRAFALNFRNGEMLRFSTTFSCPECDYSLKSLEPRLFSTASAAGACPECKGTGSVWRLDPARVIAEELSLEDGAIPGWGRSAPEHFKALENAAAALGVDVGTPWGKLPEKARKSFIDGVPGKEFAGLRAMVEKEIRACPEKDRGTFSQPFRSLCTCPECGGSGLSLAARNVFLESGGQRPSLPELLRTPVSELRAALERLALGGRKGAAAEKILPAVISRLSYLEDVGLGYLTLGRTADSLSGGEAERVRLACEIGSGLSGVLYVLDEPTAGLHPADVSRLFRALEALRDNGNTVVVVEHDEMVIRNADYLIEMGPAAGAFGGEVIAEGTIPEIMGNPSSPTGRFLSSPPGSVMRPNPPEGTKWIRVENARGRNLKGATASFPGGCLTAVSGVSGSGKSTLVNGTLFAAASRKLNGSALSPLPADAIEGLECFDKAVRIDQKPLGRSSRSNPATAMGFFDDIRRIFSETTLAKERGYGPERFSFNVKGGRCEACQGEGTVHVGMQFLPDVTVPCEVCHGTRYNSETLEVRYKGLSIAEVLGLPVSEAAELFSAHPAIRRKLDALISVGLGYLRLGQPAQTLSGGEAQRLKIASELSRPSTGRTLYLLDEPTSGLHFDDIRQLCCTLRKLCSAGNTVIVVEHSLEVIAAADWVVDMGPGGPSGGRVLFEGTPKSLCRCGESLTGKYLRAMLSRRRAS